MKVSRRTLIKAGALAGAAAALSGCTAQPMSSTTAGQAPDTRTFRTACPRNCFDTCGQIATVQNGVLRKVDGDPLHGYTQGRLCLKGYTYVHRNYSPDRIKYPMIQEPRGSGNWRRISWDEALTIIANKILELKQRYGSTLPVALNKYSGNFGILHYAVEGMFQSIGYHTYALGTPCWPAGIDATNYDFGAFVMDDPETMAQSRYIIIWGANPAWNGVHQMDFIRQAKESGAKVVVIDPINTATASQADLFIQIKPSTDGALALGMARWIIDNNLHDEAYLNSYVKGWPEFEAYLRKEVTLEWASAVTGVPVEAIVELASGYATIRPSMIWIGYGMQRHTNGGQNVRAIDALGAITGQIGTVGGGVLYGHLATWGFNYHVQSYGPPAGSVGLPDGKGGYTNRTVNMNNFAAEIQALTDPPVKMLWIACRNPGSQDPDAGDIRRAFAGMELVVVADQFMNHSAQMADIVLPVTTHFENWDVNVSYWHRWISINEKAVEPLFEARSDLQIAWALSKKLNELSPGSCTFPTEGDEEEWVGKEFNDGIYQLFGIRDWRELKERPAKALMPAAIWEEKKFSTPSGKFEIWSDLAAGNGLPPMPTYVPEMQPPAGYPIRFLTPHAQHSLHSQFQNLDYMMQTNPEPLLEIHPRLAEQRGIKDGDMVRVYNDLGEVRLKARLTRTVPVDTVVAYEAWFKDSDFNVNNTVHPIPADMGKVMTGNDGIAFHDNFVEIERV
ncbi:molybdopterin-dependent oxidoreductase [Symbiobacterium terraclitae]|uniref:molybdopterin-dependent oxidoreductase n=1 Tax=Symbiobacterium terraclitae TaxID=557451 RepID=UPI0035B4FDAE